MRYLVLVELSIAKRGYSVKKEKEPLIPPVDPPAVVLYMPMIGSPACVMAKIGRAVVAVDVDVDQCWT